MSDTISYQKYNPTIIVNKKLKNSYISIDKEKNITVKTPISSRAFVARFLEEKSNWIEKQFVKIENFSSLHDEALHSQEYIETRVEYFSQMMQLEFSTLKFKTLKSMWGSCNSKRVITLNKQLMRVEKNLIDYVVVHELAHLKHMNHSKLFHQLVEEYLPNSKEYRQQLKNIKLSST